MTSQLVLLLLEAHFVHTSQDATQWLCDYSMIKQCVSQIKHLYKYDLKIKMSLLNILYLFFCFPFILSPSQRFMFSCAYLRWLFGPLCITEKMHPSFVHSLVLQQLL